jgi:hypothetical protein
VDRFARGAELWARGQPFEAHEVWEDLWRETAPRSRERALLAGLIQACAAALQARRGKWDGVARLIERACGNLVRADVPDFADVLRSWGGRGDLPALPGNLWPPRASKQS